MNKTQNTSAFSLSRRIARAGKVWLNSLPRIALISILAVAPFGWSWGALQDASAQLSDSTGYFWLVISLLVNISTMALSSSCIISAMEHTRSGKGRWLRRGLRKSLRLFGWELLVSLQSVVRAFVPFAPPPAGSNPETFVPPNRSFARLLDRLPIFSGMFFYFSKMGLRAYLAVLSSKNWHENATLARGSYLQVGVFGVVVGAVGILSSAVLSNAQQAMSSGTAFPGWGKVFCILLVAQIPLTLLTAYGLILYHDLIRRANN